MKPIRQGIAVAAATGTLVVLASVPASALYSNWMYSNGNVKVNGCETSVIIGTQRVSAQELNTGSACAAGNVGVQSYYTPNGINYYESSFAWDPTLAIKDASISQGARVQH